jgi:hypothetical protein
MEDVGRALRRRGDQSSEELPFKTIELVIHAVKEIAHTVREIAENPDDETGREKHH